MSIKHVFLALIADGPIHGYELKKRFDKELGRLWPLQQAQVYNNLRLLEKSGQIELDARIVQENLPDRKHFRITAAGQAELESWLQSPLKSKRLLKDDFYLKVTTLARLVDRPEALRALLWEQREAYLQSLRDLERALTDAESAGDVVTASLVEGAILHVEADLAWLDRCEQRLVDDRSGQ